VKIEKNWIELKVRGSLECEESVSWLLSENGSLGVVIDTLSGYVEIKGYFLCDENVTQKISLLKNSLLNLKEFGIEITETIIKDKDWGEEWKKYFEPVKISQKIVIKPPWKQIEQYFPVIIDIDPGMAFGTGTHSTTKLALLALEEVLSSSDNFSVLDVGSGSGILAIASIKLGAASVVATDTDEVTTAEIEKNLALNKIHNGVKVFSCSIDKLSGKFMVVVANIIAETLIEIGVELAVKTDEKGFLILSGILEEKASRTISFFGSFGFSVFKKYQEGEWTAFILKKG
jgi:ribosomal protein L11 methyltransferase